MRLAFSNLKIATLSLVLLAPMFVMTPIVNATVTGPLVYSTFLGGGLSDYASSLFVDGSGNAYVAGRTMSADFPVTPGAFSTTFRGGSYDTDAFVAKLNPQGSGLAFATFLGGSSSDWASSITLDATGNIYVTGTTMSADFPTTPGSFQPTAPSGTNAFVAKLSPQGDSLVYSTFLGGSQGDDAHAIAIDASGNSYVTGSTGSADFPVTPGAFDTSLTGGGDAFIAKLDPTGSSLAYSTYLGGIDNDAGLAITLDGSDSAYVAGITNGMATTTGAYDTTYGGFGDAFIAKLNPGGDAIAYSTFLGSRDWDEISSLALDVSGNIFVTGYSFSTDFPTTTGSFGTIFNGSSEAFVTKIKPDLSGLLYSTLLSGDQQDQGMALTLDSAGRAYVSGTTSSTDFPTTSGAYNPNFVGGSPPSDSFVASLDSQAATLDYSTFLGGGGAESARSITLGQSGEIFVAGDTTSANFPTTTGSFDTTRGGTQYDSDAFVTELVLPENTEGSTGWFPPFLWWVLPILAGGIVITAILLYRRRTVPPSPAPTPP